MTQSIQAKFVDKAEQAQEGRRAMQVDGKMRWIKEDGTPGEGVNGDFFFTHFEDGTYHLFDEGS